MIGLTCTKHRRISTRLSRKFVQESLLVFKTRDRLLSVLEILVCGPARLSGCEVRGEERNESQVTCSWFTPFAPRSAPFLAFASLIAFAPLIAEAEYLFYAFHLYSISKDPAKGVKNADFYRENWNMPALMTEFSSCGAKIPAAESGIGWIF